MPDDAPSRAPDNPELADQLARRLGIPAQPTPPICHGFANGCRCGNCPRAGKTRRRRRPRQPWEPI